MFDKIASLAVIGAGTMGNGIAHVCAQNDRQVTLVDVNEGLLQLGLKTIEKNLGRQVKKEVLTQDQADETLDRINVTTELADVKTAALVVEAVSEDWELKRQQGVVETERIQAGNRVFG